AFPLATVTSLPFPVKLLTSKNTSFSTVGTHAPAGPPDVVDQLFESFQSPLPPTQYRAPLEDELIVKPLFPPASAPFTAIGTPDPVALMFCRYTLSISTVAPVAKTNVAKSPLYPLISPNPSHEGLRN